MHKMEDHSAHNAHQEHTASLGSVKANHSAHEGHGADHIGHEQMFRVRFWWSLLLSIPVLAYSEMIQMGIGFHPPAFPLAAGVLSGSWCIIDHVYFCAFSA